MIGGAILGAFGFPYAWLASLLGAGLYLTTTPDAEPVSEINIDAGGGALGEGKVYGWQGAYLTAQRGIPIPIVYGRHRIGGNVINLDTQGSTVPGEITYGMAYGNVTGTWYNGANTATPMANIVGTIYEKDMLASGGYIGNGCSFRWIRFETAEEVESLTIPFIFNGWIIIYGVPLEKGYPPYDECINTTQAKANRDWLNAQGSVDYPSKWFFAYTALTGQLDIMSDLKTLNISNLARKRWVIYIGGEDIHHPTPNFRINIQSISGLRSDPLTGPNSYVSYVNLLMAMGEGEVEEINDIQIEKQPLSNYAESVITVDRRFGTDTQSAISAFKGSINSNALNVNLLSGIPYIYNCIHPNTEELKVGFFTESGLYSFSEGQYANFDAQIHVEYKVAAASAWNDGGYVNMKGVSPKQFYRWWKIENLQKEIYDIRATKLSIDPDNVSTFGGVKLIEVDEVEYGDKIYPNTALLFMRLKSGEQLSGRIPNITVMMSGIKHLVPKLTDGANTVPFRSCYYAPSGTYVELLGSAVNWDGTTLEKQYSTNPAWCIYDLLSQKRYGLGDVISESILDKASFYDAGKYCDTYSSVYTSAATREEKSFEMDVVIDGRSKAPDILDQLLKSFRGFMTWTNGEIKLRIDKPENPVQVFNMSNIVENSFNVVYRDRNQRPNSVEIQFANRDLNYDKDTILLEDYNSIMTEGRRTSNLALFGVSRSTQILRTGRYYLNQSAYVKRFIEFEAGLDAVHCEAGDVFVFQHDVPQWNEGGRIVDSTATHVHFDHGITLGTAGVYQLMCQLTSDSVETRYIDPSISGYVHGVTVTGAFGSIPPQYGKWIVGQTDVLEKKYRVLQLTKTDQEVMKIQALEYNENVYNVTGDYNSAENVESQNIFLAIPDHVQNLTARVEQDYFSAILLDWNKPDSGRAYKGCDLYAKTNYGVSGESEWQYWKQTDKTNARYSPIVVNQGYAFKAVSFNEQLQHASFLSAPTTSAFVYVTGVETGNVYIVYTPPTITGLTIE
jgi:predicted phage tail protein